MATMLPTLSALAHELQRRVAHRAPDDGACSSGVPALDQLLPQGGLATAGLTEWLAESAGGGLTFALLAASQSLRARDGSILVVVDREKQFYSAALPGWDVPLDRVVLIRPGGAAEALWAWEQSLRCSAVAACLGWMPESISSVALRRLQVAAEQGGGHGFLVRPLKALREPSWADVRWRVTPVPITTSYSRPGPLRGRRFRVELVRCRHQMSGGVADVEFNPHAANPLRVVPPVAHPAVPLRATGS
jgi:protein ImuA